MTFCPWILSNYYRGYGPNSLFSIPTWIWIYLNEWVCFACSGPGNTQSKWKGQARIGYGYCSARLETLPEPDPKHIHDLKV
jgi:hypothetical protein